MEPKKLAPRANYRTRGTYYEGACAAWLEKQGYVIIDKNYRCRMGEVDLIARNEGYYVFIEVKFRQDRSMGAPYEAVNVRKQMKIRQTARWYMMAKHLPPQTPVRFDVVSICGSDIQLFKNAFY